jgi:1-acyl-sn-glycerol-3-phosphate acyltransferase
MEEPTRTYRLVLGACRPLGWWGRLEVTGLDALPATGGVLIVGNHDSHWDPILIGLAARDRRQIRALAKSSLWKVPGLGGILDRMGQIPIERGTGDVGALERAVEELRAGACIGIFPEGTISRGEELRARGGVARLALAVPEARLVLVAIEGATDYVRFPRRPRVRVRFLEPPSGQAQESEERAELATRLLADLRQLVPPTAAGRG